MPDGVVTGAARDGFEEYFAEKLWAMLPGVYRHEDGPPDRPGPLRALVEILATQAAVVRRSGDRLWEDEFIETCDDWAVPYIGDLVATRMVSALNSRGRRVDVANTIGYRRRKGTLTVLEQLTSDITGWQGAAVEAFRRLARARHGLDPRPGPLAGRLSGTPPGGFADLRSQYAGELAGGAFDEFHRTADVRRHRGPDGRYGIPKLALHLYGLQPYPLSGVTPFARSSANAFTLDPSGRTTPLFMPEARTGGDARVRARPWELPGPIGCRLLGNAEFMITEEIVQGLAGLTAGQAAGLRRLRGLRFRDEASLDELVAAHTGGLPTQTLSDLHRAALVSDCGRRALLPAAVRLVESTGPVPRDVTVAGNLAATTAPSPAGKRLVIDPEAGLILFLGAAPSGLTADYWYGFSGEIGAGGYDRDRSVAAVAGRHIGGGVPIASADVDNTGVTQIDDSATYAVAVTKLAIADATLQAADRRRPYLRLTNDLSLGTAVSANGTLVLGGLWFGGSGRVVLKGSYDRVTISHCTFDPGGVDADGAPIPPVPLRIEADVDELVVDASIMALVEVAGGSVERLTVRDSIVDARSSTTVAVLLPAGFAELVRVTVFGGMDVHRLSASEVLATGTVDVTDTQAGCWRFSAAPAGSRLPRAYESHVLADSGHLFTSRTLGRPGYAQLSGAAPDELARGAENGSELGAFSALVNPIKLDSLRTKVDEYLPFGLIPVFIKET